MSEAFAPSNIALIKYMGKIEGAGNRPTNASISWTLSHLLTAVTLEKIEGPSDEWAPLEKPGFGAPTLSAKGLEKFLNHFKFLKETFGGKGSYRIRSANNFPSDCGLASSASSFAALTKAAAHEFGSKMPAAELSKLSRKGSGSSCRSFFAPWAVWEDEGAERVELGYPELLHAAVIISTAVKDVSSSDAHKRVTTSLKFAGRPERANARMRKLMSCLKENDWKGAHQITWDEFNDMHELFETSVPAFKYRNKDSQNVVDACHHIWKFKDDGPLVTMDAGPNVHLLFRPDQKDLADKMVKHFREKHITMTSWSGLK